MNLTTYPWIPVVWNDGRADLVSLREVFERGHEIRDLAVRPHERIALMRLLVCVAQAALDGPADYADWLTCRDRIPPAALDYLGQWKPAFELFGDGQRFLQVADLKPMSAADDGEGSSTSKLDLALATGNNTTVFDNAGGTDREFTPAQLALALLAFQCFSPGGRIGVARWRGTLTVGEGSSNHAPCLPGGMLHGILRGNSLLETVHLNVLSKDSVEMFVPHGAWGRPIWERKPSSSGDAAAVTNATQTYLGRLVPLTRAACLDGERNAMTLANGLDYPAFPDWREPTATIVVRERNGQPERVVMNASLDKAPWRELHALAVKRIGQDTNGGVVALQNLSCDRAFDLWVGGLVADKAKLVDAMEAVFHVPAGMLTELCQHAY